ncbi:MAG: siroheme synthase CysG [Cycloclasticus sp.]|jgi:uroporphyrinogen-III C-methyltransferase (EC 2.1.1.107)/precorrin-2 dehydrogenase (EC 1.3.1.76)
MKYYPLFFKLENKRCLIVGGGAIALRRAKSLIAAGAIIDVLASTICQPLTELLAGTEGRLSAAAFSVDLLSERYALIIAATDQPRVNQAVTDYAQQHAIPLNRVDEPSQCDFIFPSVIDRSPLTIAVSNSGSSPVLSKLLKRQIEHFVPKAYGELSSLVGAHREQVKQRLPVIEQRSGFWQKVLQGNIAEAFISGKTQQAKQLLGEAVANPEQFMQQGEVYLIGAGPGDAELLTLKAFRLLQSAQVVLHDRLVSPEVMALVNKSAELVYVGKRRDQHSVPQGGINQLLIDYAKLGKRVVRLKGGDPFIFGRGGEEIETLVEEGVAFQVIPGITAASGCSSYAGIPLTHRDYAQSVQFVTGQLQDGSINLNWSELIAPSKTLVFYMGLKGLPIICRSLIDNGMAADMPCAIVEKGTTPSQRVMVSTLDLLPQAMSQQNITSPSLFIVGEVVSLSHKLNWFNT